jgi:hypothetical protein
MHTFRSAMGPLFAVLACLPVSAVAAQVTIASVTASSEYPADETGSYEAKRVADGKVSTTWVEGESGSGRPSRSIWAAPRTWPG